MIDLTPLEVRQKKGDFRHALRGYDPELVNDFLDLVADRLEDLVKENMALREAARSGQDELTAYRHKEQALSEALMAAQRVREDARSHAEKERELVIREAQLAARTARAEATRQIAREEEALRQVRARRAQLVESFRRLLEREIRELAIIEETLELKGGGADEAADRAAPVSPDALAPEHSADAALSIEEAGADEPETDGGEDDATVERTSPFETALAQAIPEPFEEADPEAGIGSSDGSTAQPTEGASEEVAGGVPEALVPEEEGPSDGAVASRTGESDVADREAEAELEDEDVIDLPEDWLASLMEEESPPREGG